MAVVFSESIDAMLLAMEGDEEEGSMYKLVDRVDLSVLCPDPTRILERAFIACIQENNLNLDQPCIAAPKDWDDAFSFSAIYMCKDFYISVGYYSVGSSVASASIFLFKDGKYFKKNGDFYAGMRSLFSEDATEAITIF